MKLTSEQIKAFRKAPVSAAKYLLGIELTWFQAIMLNLAWKKLFCMWICSRGLGKTYVGAIWLILKCLLYKNVKAWVFAKDFGYTQATYEKIEEIYERSPLFQNELKREPRTSKSSWSVLFKNGSYIRARPIIRSKRADVILIDEAREMDFSILNTVVIPMLNVKNYNTDGDGNLLIVSSADYEFRPLYQKYKEYEEQVEKGNPDYGLCIFDVNDALTGPWMNEAILRAARDSLLPEEYEMEYLSKFVSLSGGWITGYLVRQCERDFVPEFKGDSNYEYFIAVDPGRVKDGDNTSFIVCKIVPNEGVRVVRVVSMNGEAFDDQAMKLRQLVKDFGNVITLVMDGEKCGIAIGDDLKKPSIDPRDGEYLPPIVSQEDTETDVPGTLRIIKNVNFRNISDIWDRGLLTKKYLQNEVLLFPKDKYKIVLNDDEIENLTEKEQEVYLAYREIIELKKEICSVKVKASSSSTACTFYTDSARKLKKDRFTALFLCASEAGKYFEELSGEDDDDCPICTTVMSARR